MNKWIHIAYYSLILMFVNIVLSDVSEGQIQQGFALFSAVVFLMLAIYAGAKGLHGKDERLITYIDYFDSPISESIDSMIWRIKTLEENETKLRKRLVDLGEKMV